MNKLLEEQAKLAGRHRRGRRLGAGAQARNRRRRTASAAWDAIINKLSGGEKRRVALCRLLLSAPDMLLLDEPTNHLDAESIAWLEKYLEAYPSTVIAVTHDRYFLDNVAEWILELDAAMAFPTRATTPPGSSKRARGSPQKREPTKACASSLRQNSNGCARTPRRAAPRTRRAWRVTRNSLARIPGAQRDQ
jgi:ATPase subunit of ABC transporter with duplicated ATPase domains